MRNMPSHLSIDVETYSSENLKDCGIYRYIESEDFEVTLCSYSWDFGPVQTIDLANGEQLPQDFIDALKNPAVEKHAFNASFEINCLKKLLGEDCTDIKSWIDTMALAHMMGFPEGLEKVGNALGIDEDKKKLREGKEYVKYFSMPCKPSKSNGKRTRNLPSDDPEKWNKFKEYNARDVEAETEIYLQVCAVLVTNTERQIFVLDYQINNTGVRIDNNLVQSVISMNDEACNEAHNELCCLTKLDNPNSRVQLQRWLANKGYPMSSLEKEAVEEALANHPKEEIKKALQLQQILAKTSMSKYYKMQKAVCSDGRIRGLLSYYGAKTGRWAGRLVQLHNLKRNELDCLDYARKLALNKDTDMLKMLYGENLVETLSQLCRTALIPAKGYKFIVVDFNAIEARVLAWLANQQSVLDVFNRGEDLYCQVASQMFGVPVEKDGLNSNLRKKGKIAVLACGYQGSTGAMKNMGADKMGLSEEEIKDIVSRYRNANSNICAFWYHCHEAAVDVIRLKGAIYKTVGKVTFRYEISKEGRTFLTIELPSGRKIYYPYPGIIKNNFDKLAPTYMGQNSVTKKWERHTTYGGNLVENITQAVARDCLAEVMLRIKDLKSVKIVFHVHDELILESEPQVTLNQICQIIEQPIDWAPGLPLKVAGYEGYYYRKD